MVSVSQNLSVGGAVNLANSLNCSDYTYNGSIWSITSGPTNRKKLVFNLADTIINGTNISFNDDTNSSAFGNLNGSGLNLGSGASAGAMLYLASGHGEQSVSPFWTNYSDARVKQNIKYNNLDKSIEIFKQLKFKSFNYKDQEEKTDEKGMIIQRAEIRSDKTKIGLLAQDVEQIEDLKDCVSLDTNSGFKKMNYDLVFFHGLAVVQDLLKRIEVLEKKNKVI